MLDEENDKRIKEAADHYHPEYDETAWQKMEQLLDEHLPVEKERKRIFFLIPSLLFVGCLLLLIGLYNWKNNKPTTSQKQLSKNKIENAIVPDESKDAKKSTAPISLESKKNAVTITTNEKKAIEKNNINPVQVKSINNKPVFSSVKNKNQNTIAASDDDFPKNEMKQTTEKTNNTSAINHDDVSKNTTIENKSVITPREKENRVDVEKSFPKKEITKETSMSKNEKVAGKNEPGKTKKLSHGFANNFGVSVSAGPDISGVQANKIGKLTLAYGAGFSYAINKKFSMRTGFYLSKKIYSVSPNDYRLPPGSSGNYEYLENIDANCNVYEIPLKLDYSFEKIKNHSWFVSTGLSSYLMKKETYDYYYKTPAGVIYNKDWSISNKNKHFFSVLDISGGYQYSLNKQFSIIAEPYINIPLTGIGAGKVKLNSGGILFTIKAKPFLKSH